MKYLIVLIMLTGCAVTDPIGARLSPGALITSDLNATSRNLDQAVAVGALKTTDPAPQCLHDLIARFGAGQETFEPEISGLISLQSVAYIRAQQIKNRGDLSPSCKAIIGEIVVGRFVP